MILVFIEQEQNDYLINPYCAKEGEISQISTLNLFTRILFSLKRKL